jgi:dolichyl-phosphate beta-glucosyltransferase
MSFHIVVPAYNETANLENCIETLTTLYPENPITIAADASPDNTDSLALRIAEKHNNVFVDYCPFRRGKGWAIKNALLTNRANAYLDADFSVNPYNLTPMFELLRQRGGIIITKRIPQGRSFKRSLSSKLYNNTVRLLFRTGISDHQCGCKLLSPEATAIAQNVQANDFFYDTELIINCKRAGLTVTEYPAIWTEAHKKSNVKTLRDGARMLKQLIKLRLKF